MSILTNVEAMVIYVKNVILSGFAQSCCVPRVVTRVCDSFTPSGF